MKHEVTFRPVTLDDAEMLLSWRNDALTSQNSINTEPVGLADHLDWLKKSLKSSERRLFIALFDGKPVGAVRIDHSSEGTELSWTVAPEARGKGMGSRMVIGATHLVSDNLIAKIKKTNEASIQIAKKAGFKLAKESVDMTHWILEKH